MKQFTIYFIILISFLLYNCKDCATESTEPDYECTDPIDCIEWCNISEGSYIGGADNISTTIDYDYQIMVNEVTNEQYIYFLNQYYELGLISIYYGHVHGYFIGNDKFPADSTQGFTLTYENDPQFPIKFQKGIFSIDSSLLNHPADYISWYGATAFADFYGFKLPSSGEWEKAARGDTGYRFPWGNTEDLDRANIWDSGDPFDNGTTPIGFYDGDVKLGYQTKDDSSPYGVHDIIGNVCEWTRSFDNETNHYIFKGMSWGANWYPDCWMNFSANPHSGIGLGKGFRCVR